MITILYKKLFTMWLNRRDNTFAEIQAIEKKNPIHNEA